MTSSDQVTGRTWFDGSPPIEEPLPLQCYMGLRISTSLLRSNAMTFSDFRDEHEADSMRVLLRMFLRVQHVLVNSKPGQGAVAILEWDATSAMDRPGYVYIHVMYNPSTPDADIATEAQKVIVNLMESDAKQFRQARPGRQLQVADMVVSTDMWAAMCNVYTHNTPDTDDILECQPTLVFSQCNAGIESPESTLRIPTGQYVRMANSDLNPSIFFQKFAPWYQTAQLPDYPLRCADALQSAVLRRVSRALPHGNRQNTQSVWEQIVDKQHRARELYTEPEAYKKWATSEIEHGLDGPQAAFVAAGEKAINEYELSAYPDAPHADADLSPMGTWVTWFLMQSETYAYVYKQHLLLLKLFVGSLDCMREASQGEIHYSAILAGPNSTSKSYLFTLLERMLISGTVDRATRRTENSLTYQFDQGCRILMDHELPADFFGDSTSRKDSSSRTSQTKEILTSHEARVEACQYVDGERVKCESKSRAHLCYLAATNDWSVGQNSKGDSGKDAALVSRFDVIFPTKSKIRDKCIMELMALERNPTEVDKTGLQGFFDWARTIQKCTYWILRLIAIGAMEPVNLDAAHTVIDRFCKARESSASQRTIERIVIISRLLNIITAIHAHYGMPTSPRKNEIPVVAHMKELEPALVVTAEQAKFAMGLFKDDFESTVEHATVDAMRQCTLRADPDLGFSYVKVMGCDTAQQLVDEIMMRVDANVEVTADSVHATLARLRTRQIVSVPYVPCVDAELGVVKDHTKAEQKFYSMRGNSIHAALITEQRASRRLSFDDIIDKNCHIGPPMKEIKAVTVPGFAHVLQTRTLRTPPIAYIKSRVYLPPCTASILGNNACKTLQQSHRKNSRQMINTPVETQALQSRGGQFQAWAEQARAHARKQAHSIDYPSSYVREVETHNKRVASILQSTELTAEQQCASLHGESNPTQ